ncbi:MAG: STM4012 family radical SAM protein [Cyanobacteria bacterium P01_F01_bin.150]
MKTINIRLNQKDSNRTITPTIHQGLTTHQKTKSLILQDFSDLSDLLEQSPYQGYVYGYPHKTAYRPFPARSLSSIWATERKDALFLYIHIPFCEMRCGFCNLFTTVNHNQDVAHRYVQTVKRQAHRIKAALGKSQFAQFAIGGGTPTQLPTADLEQILDIAQEVMGANLTAVPGSVEVSPDTATTEKLRMLRDRGVARISMGVQSFIDREVQATRRRQTVVRVEAALERIRRCDFPIVNLDLIYGLPEQTLESWQHSVQRAIALSPEELYLYPLYVRPLTGLGMSDREWDDHRLACYRVGRELLLDAGYQQVSMRMFRLSHTVQTPGPVYCCQADGMVGLGCGARSYTRSLHYSNDYAVNAKEIRGILAAYIESDDAAFDVADYGFELNRGEQQRRFILLSLLSEDGLDLREYGDRFQTNALIDVPELLAFQTSGLVERRQMGVYLTPLGLERSDAIGPALFSETVQGLMETYRLK